ncbi:MAG: Re/Si-specific NAD(P)(+) transhydrogenase subunit alpha [Bacteroidales bacterium]|nr:Re/Si-specific NAD(P)(+) transhydrogenase subunit alpha [Bacteroidales bacterium]
MTAGILKEPENENRVALLPGEAAALKKLGHRILVENGAGTRAYASDQEYSEAGAEPADRKSVIDQSDIILSVHPPVNDDITLFRKGQVICSVVNPVLNSSWLSSAMNRGLTVLALDMIPRITRAQAMDVLSSMATVSGYKAVIEAASLLPRFFPMFMTAAGTIKPAKVLVLGAGVAGLQALAIARKLGAVVEVFDVRSAVREEVKSLGGKFIEVEGAREDASAGGYAVEQSEEFAARQKELIHKHAVSSDVIISTALVPGKKAPVLIKKETVLSMRPGSVIIDLAASGGGNCECTAEGKMIELNGVRIIGRSDYPSEMPTDASKMFGNNIISLLKVMTGKNGELILDMNDEIIKGTTAVHAGQFVSERVRQLLNIN